MTIKNVAVSFVLGLLFVSLLTINLTVPPSVLVRFLSVIIMAISLVIALGGSWRDIAVMGAFAALVSLVAAYFFGVANVGSGVIGMIVWGALLLALPFWASRNVLTVPRDQAILILNRFTGRLYMPVPPLAPPVLPLVERIIAKIPLYELSENIEVKGINTRANHNIDKIVAHVRYKVVEPRRAMGAIPKRAQLQHEVAREMGRDLENARMDIVFWERLFGRQLQIDVSQAARDVVFSGEYPRIQNAPEAYEQRVELGKAIEDRLNEFLGRWGAQVTSFELEHFEVSDERFRALNMERIIERETRMKQLEAEREATRIRITNEAEAAAEAKRIELVVRALQDAGVTLSAEIIEEIVISAIRSSAEWPLEVDYESLFEPNRTSKG